MRLVLWRPYPPGAVALNNAAAPPLISPNRGPSGSMQVVPGGKQPWSYYTQDARRMAAAGAPIYEDLVASTARRIP